MHDFIHSLSFQAGYAFVATRRVPSALAGVMRSFEVDPAIAYRPSPQARARSARRKARAQNRR